MVEKHPVCRCLLQTGCSFAYFSAAFLTAAFIIFTIVINTGTGFILISAYDFYNSAADDYTVGNSGNCRSLFRRIDAET